MIKRKGIIRRFKPKVHQKHIKPKMLRSPALKRKSKPTKAPSISKLIAQADKLFSIRTRTNGAWMQDGELWNQCFTSGYKAPVRKLQCGHYLSRWYKSARWDFDNARPQSMPENIFKKGNAIAFRENLLKEIGEARVLAVEAKRGVSLKLTRDYLTNLIQSLS